MRGDAERQANMLLAVTPDSFIPEEHPIRRIKPIVESALARLSSLFDGMYADRGRPSIPPEHLLKASLLIALSSIRSERQFCERLRYDFAWGGKTSCGPPILMMQTSWHRLAVDSLTRRPLHRLASLRRVERQ